MAEGVTGKRGVSGMDGLKEGRGVFGT